MTNQSQYLTTSQLGTDNRLSSDLPATMPTILAKTLLFLQWKRSASERCLIKLNGELSKKILCKVWTSLESCSTATLKMPIGTDLSLILLRLRLERSTKAQLLFKSVQPSLQE